MSSPQHPEVAHPLDRHETAMQLRGELLGFVRRRIQNSSDAEDLVQEILLRIVRSVASLRSRERFHAWVYQIARGVLADYWHTHRRDQLREPEDPNLPAVDARKQHASHELAECLRIFSSRLPEPYREAVELSEMAGLPHREIADRLGISVSGVKSRVQRGRDKLKLLVLDCCAVDLRGGEVHSCEAKAPHRSTAPCGCGPR